MFSPREVGMFSAAWKMLKDTVLAFINDEALSRGAAIAFYTVTSIGPVLLIVIAIAGLAFGQDAAQNALTAQLSGLKPINAKCETVRSLPSFREAYRKCRCLVPVDGFFEWKAIKGEKAKQPYAIAMKDGAPFGI